MSKVILTVLGALYTFAPGVEVINTCDEKGNPLKITVEEISERVDSGDEDMLDWLKEKVKSGSNILIKLDKEDADNVSFLAKIQSENEDLKAELEKIKAAKPEKVSDLEKENEALKAELEKLKAKSEKAETAKADSKKEGGV